MSARSELSRAVLDGQAAKVQSLLLRPLIDGTTEELERKLAARAEPEARLRAAERALADGTAAETAAVKARVVAQELYHTIQSEGDEWAEIYSSEVESADASPRSVEDMHDDIVFATESGLPQLLTQEQVASARRRRVRSAQTFASLLAKRSILPAPWEPLSQLNTHLSDEKDIREQTRPALDAKAAANQVSTEELAQLRQLRWADGMAQLRRVRVGHVLYDPDAVNSLYNVQNDPPWVQETKEFLTEWACVHDHSDARIEEWAGAQTVPVRVTKALFEGLAEVGPKDTGCESWQSEILWVIDMLDTAKNRKRSGWAPERRSTRSHSQLNEIFAKADRNGDGAVSRGELISRLRKDQQLAAMLGLPSHVKDEDREEFEVLFQGMDSDSSGNIDRDEFVRYFSCSTTGQQLEASCSLDSILTELLVLGGATVCLPAQFSQDQIAEYVARVLEPLNILKRHGWYHPGAMVKIARLRASEAHRQLESAEQVECKHADEVEDATDDIEQYNQQLKETEHEIKELEARIALYRGPIDSIRGRLEGRVSAADGDYTGGAESLAMDRRNQRLQDVALYGTGTDMRTLAPVSGSSLALMAAWRGHLEVLEVLLALQADPNRAAPDGSTPLYMAAGTGRADIVAVLLKAGAEPGQMKPGGFSPLWNAAMHREHGGTRTPWPHDWRSLPVIERDRMDSTAEELSPESARLKLCCSEYRDSFMVKESTRLLASQVGTRPQPQPRLPADPDSLATVEALLSHGQRKVDAARAHRDAVAKAMVVELDAFTSASNELAARRDKEAEMVAICDNLQTELEELKSTALADEKDSDTEDPEGETQSIEYKPSAKSRFRSVVRGAQVGADLQRRRGRSPDPGEGERTRAPRKTAQQIRRRWKVSAALGSEFSRRSRSPGPSDRLDAMWTAAATASAQRHFRVWICEICGKRRIPVDLSECPLCGKEKPPGPEPCPDYDIWKRVVDDESGMPYWYDVTGKKESTWDPPPGWEDEFYRRTSMVKPQSREARQLAKLEKHKDRLAGEKAFAKPRPQVDADDMARLAAVFMTVDADGSGTVSLQELSDALQKDSALARMLNLAEHHDTQTKALAEETDANLTREDSIKLLFEAMDRNKDGTITREEFMSFFASGQAKRAAGGGLGWQILRNKMPWVLEAEELVGEWVRVVDRDSDGQVEKREAKSMLRALAEFRAIYAASVLKEAGIERKSKTLVGTAEGQESQQQQQRQGKVEGSTHEGPEPESQLEPESESQPEPETDDKSELEPDESEGEETHSNTTGPSNQLFSSLKKTREKRLMRKSVLSAMFRQADTNNNGKIARSELILTLRRNKDMATILDLPQKITDQERAAFERVFQAMDRDDDRGIDEKEFIRFFTSGKAAAAAFKLGAKQRHEKAATGIEAMAEDWDWEDLLEELDVNDDGRLSAKELMDIDSKNYRLYTTCVLKPLQELKHNGWFHPSEMAKLCLKRLGQAEAKLGQRQMRMRKAEQRCAQAMEEVRRKTEELAAADKSVSIALKYLGQYLNLPAGGSGAAVVHLVAERGDIPMLNLLLRTDALDLNKAKADGTTPLHCAARNGHLAVVQALLDAGAMLDVPDGAGQSASDHARLCSGMAKSSEIDTMLMGARLQRQLANALDKA